MKRKRTKSIIVTILTAILMISAPPIHAQASTDYSVDELSQLISSDENLLFVDLFLNYLGEGKNMTYWEEEVAPHIKEGIIKNAEYQTKLQYVLDRAYQKGHYKVDFISDSTIPEYSEPSFDETLYNQTFAFEEGDLYYAIHGINGHVVIDAAYLGDDQFEVWVAIEDYYDFDHIQDCEFGLNLCTLTNGLDSLEELHVLGTEFYVTIGFTYTASWSPDTSTDDWAVGTESSAANIVEATPNITDSQTSVSQYFWKSDYNEGWYEGEWSNEQPNGYGKLTYDDFSDGKYYALIFSDSECKALYYEGLFSDGCRYGEGTVVYENGYKDEGTFYGSWQDGKIVFQGKRWLITDQYNGYWPITITATGTTTSNTEYGSWQSVK